MAAHTIDFAPCSLNQDASVLVSDADLKLIGQRIVAEFQEHGCISLKNTGFTSKMMNKARRLGEEFFNLPEVTKKKHALKDAASSFVGYIPLGQEWLNSDDPRDFKESVLMMHYSFERMSDLDGELPGFCATMKDVFNDYITVGDRVLQCIALAAGFEKDAFQNCYGNLWTEKESKEVSMLKIINYPPLKEQDDEKKYTRCSRHKDLSLLTLLLPIDVDGLQLMRPSGEWVDVESEQDVLIVHAGYHLEVMLAGLIQAWDHRVVFRDDKSRMKSRLGVVLFLGGRPGMTFKPLDGSTSYSPHTYPNLSTDDSENRPKGISLSEICIPK